MVVVRPDVTGPNSSLMVGAGMSRDLVARRRMASTASQTRPTFQVVTSESEDELTGLLRLYEVRRTAPLSSSDFSAGRSFTSGATVSTYASVTSILPFTALPLKDQNKPAADKASALPLSSSLRYSAPAAIDSAPPGRPNRSPFTLAASTFSVVSAVWNPLGAT